MPSARHSSSIHPASGAVVPVLYEDDHLIAVAKPAGMVVHPTYKNSSGTLLDVLRERTHDWPASARPSIVGRLDKLTSGIVIAAKTREVHAALQRLLASDGEKYYLAIVRGHVSAERGVIDLPLRVDRSDRRRVVVSADGSPCLTRFERLATVDGLSLLRCRLMTGRRHQIRVHLAAQGWPIVGDPMYGESCPGFGRQALHAWRIAVPHPAIGERLRIEAPVPDDLSPLFERFGKS